jgi:hypothetical protein
MDKELKRLLSNAEKKNGVLTYEFVDAKFHRHTIDLALEQGLIIETQEPVIRGGFRDTGRYYRLTEKGQNALK